MSENDSYAATGVDYSILDTAKRLAQEQASSTGNNARRTGIVELSTSRGESAFVWEDGNVYRAMVMEGLGTKSLIADSMRTITGKTYYDQIAQDTVAAIINDLIVVGADPQIITAYWGVGNSDRFSDLQRVEDLVRGWKQACDLAGVTWGGGETPTLTGIINQDTIDLGGSAVGVINPKENLVLGDKLTEGDEILLVESSGIQANGLTLVRSIADKLPQSYATSMADGNLFGEALLTPTNIYASLIRDLQVNAVDIHYMVNITGHGWRKLMRATKDFSYVIDQTPKPQELFNFIQKKGNLSDIDMYGTFNMGAGFAIYVPPEYSEQVIKLGQENHNLKIIKAGKVQKGPKQVIINPLNITFEEKTLQVR